MSNIEKIKAEIERQLEYFKGKEDDAWDDSVSYTDEDALWYQGHWKMCSRLLAFIDSLPEEHLRDSTKMISKDLDEAAENYIAPIENDEGLDYINFNGQEIKDAFKAGAEWQYQKDRREFAKLKTKD